jgi:hypothetical protein
MNGIGITLVTLLAPAAPALAQNEYDKGQGTARWEDTGEILYVRDRRNYDRLLHDALTNRRPISGMADNTIRL